jgi:NADPH-dependent 2,4-dienoyl-CoA reductase/sulfur reductase-like enzyme
MRVAVIGNGVAGVEAALAVRRREPDAEIAILSEESDHFFSRTALMYVLAGQLSYRDIEPHDRGLYGRMRFRRVRARARAVRAGQVEIVGGPPIPFDRLVIASGSRPRAAPWGGSNLAGIGHFVTLQDLRWLELCIHGREGVDLPERLEVHAATSQDDSPYLPRPPVRDVRNPVVIGGGLIGVEAVETLLAAGLRPTFVYREEWFWSLALDAREGAWIAERLRDHGATVVSGADIGGFVGRDRVEGVRVGDQTLPCDLAVVAIGVVPNTDWLGDALDRAPDGGIRVDDQLRTSLSNVWAAGDCAAVPQPGGANRCEQLWYTARDQGRIAAANVLGDGLRYDRGVWYNSAKLMDEEYTTVGRIPGEPVPGAREWWFEERDRVHSTLRIALDDGDRVVGMNALGRRWDHEVWIRWIEERRPLSWVVSRLGEASFDTEFVPPLRIGAA